MQKQRSLLQQAQQRIDDVLAAMEHQANQYTKECADTTRFAATITARQFQSRCSWTTETQRTTGSTGSSCVETTSVHPRRNPNGTTPIDTPKRTPQGSPNHKRACESSPTSPSHPSTPHRGSPHQHLQHQPPPQDVFGPHVNTGPTSPTEPDMIFPPVEPFH